MLHTIIYFGFGAMEVCDISLIACPRRGHVMDKRFVRRMNMNKKIAKGLMVGHLTVGILGLNLTPLFSQPSPTVSAPKIVKTKKKANYGPAQWLWNSRDRGF